MKSTSPPSSILIIGSGVFGLSTLYELLQRPTYANCSFTLLSSTLPSPNSTTASLYAEAKNSAAQHKSLTALTASYDTTRIIRGDYADGDYALLAREARVGWKGAWGSDGRYQESGIVLTADKDSEGAKYVEKALENVRKSGETGLKDLVGAAAISSAMRVPATKEAGTGDVGYFNPHSGWGDAAACTLWLYRKVEALAKSKGNVRFVRDEAVSLLHDASAAKVRGATLEGGESLNADLTILASGAWTASLLDLDGIASARGQGVLYIDISTEQAQQLSALPVHFNMASGLFFFPPTRNAKGGWELKVARHGYGYSNPTRVRSRLSHNPEQDQLAPSLPAFPQDLPLSEKQALLDFLDEAIPTLKLKDSPHAVGTRVCWYLDTETGDYLIGQHPHFHDSLFLATGGSGHAFKFLPALGTHIVDVLDGTDVRTKGGSWTRKWAWREPKTDENGKIVSEVWCHDGSRGGITGVSLQEAFATGQKQLSSKL